MAEILSKDTFKAGLVAEGAVTVPASPANPTDATSKQYVDGLLTPNVYIQASAPAPAGVDMIFVDIDDTSMEGSDVAGVWLRWTGTQAQYNAIAVKDPNTLYCVKG